MKKEFEIVTSRTKKGRCRLDTVSLSRWRNRPRRSIRPDAPSICWGVLHAFDSDAQHLACPDEGVVDLFLHFISGWDMPNIP